MDFALRCVTRLAQIQTDNARWYSFLIYTDIIIHAHPWKHNMFFFLKFGFVCIQYKVMKNV